MGTPLFDKEQPLVFDEIRYGSDDSGMEVGDLMTVWMHHQVSPKAKLAFNNVPVRGLKIETDINGQQWIVLVS